MGWERQQLHAQYNLMRVGGWLKMSLYSISDGLVAPVKHLHD